MESIREDNDNKRIHWNSDQRPNDSFDYCERSHSQRAYLDEWISVCQLVVRRVRAREEYNIGEHCAEEHCEHTGETLSPAEQRVWRFGHH